MNQGIFGFPGDARLVVPVVSVGGKTGDVTNAEIAAAATAGYGYTPTSPASLSTALGSYMPKDFGAGNFPVGSLVSGPMQVGSTVAAGASFAASANNVTMPGVSGPISTGTWRVVGAGLNSGTPVISTIQRIA